MEVNLFNALLLLGWVQGGIVMVVALRHKALPKTQRLLLAGIVGVLTLATLGTFLNHAVNYNGQGLGTHLWVNNLPFYVVMPMGPLLYFYGHSLFSPGFTLTRRHGWHFIGVVLDLLPFIASVATALLWHAGQVTEATGWGVIRWFNSYNSWVDLPRFVSAVVYLVLSWRYLQQQGSEGQAAHLKTRQWYRSLLVGITILAAVWLPFLVVYLSPVQGQLLKLVYYFPIYYPIVGLLYYLSFSVMQGRHNLPQQVAQQANATHTLQAMPNMVQKAEQLRQLVARQQLYLKPDLRLEELSRLAGIPEKTVSYLLNHHIKKGFNDFINEFRVQAALQRMDSEAMARLTLEGIALEVGFSSRSTFYRAFKKSTGQSPSAYMASASPARVG